jgi:cytosine/adenosine deaminase-related metal-dependent hydrolase
LTRLLITDVIAVTMDPQRRIVTDAAIAVEGDTIVALGKLGDIPPRFARAERVIAGRRRVALPGLIDAHAHSPQAMLRGVADDLPWRPYLEKFVWPLQGSYDADDATTTLQLCITEMLRGGTTCFVDPLVHSRYDFDRQAATIEAMGIRAVMAKSVMDQTALAQQIGVLNEGMLETEEQSLAEAERAIRRWDGGANGRIQVWYGPRVPREPATACSPDFYAKVARLAREKGVGITVHLAGEKEDLPYFRREYDAQPVEFMERVGMIGPNVLLAMCCWVSEEEIKILSRTDTMVVHCPSANMKMASGVAKVREMRAAGVTVALGCDSGANNNCYDMVREMKAASLLQNIHTMDAEALTAEDALEMATIDGARAIGQGDRLGSLEAGKKADIILVNLRQAHAVPSFDIISNLVYTGQGSDVESVIIDGNLVMEERRVLVADEDAILTEAEARGRALLERTGIRVASRWPVE